MSQPVDQAQRITRDGRSALGLVDRVVFGVAAAAVAFVVWGVSDRPGLASVTGDTLTWVTDSLGWLFVLSSAAFVLFAVGLAVSKHGRIRLGPDDVKPEFSTFSWVSMMFATGMGIGLGRRSTSSSTRAWT